jgi:hypothetical protein
MVAYKITESQYVKYRLKAIPKQVSRRAAETTERPRLVGLRPIKRDKLFSSKVFHLISLSEIKSLCVSVPSSEAGER